MSERYRRSIAVLYDGFKVHVRIALAPSNIFFPFIGQLRTIGYLQMLSVLRHKMEVEMLSAEVGFLKMLSW